VETDDALAQEHRALAEQRAALEDLKRQLQERVAAVSERALTVEPGDRAVLAVDGIRPKRASTASRCAAAPRPKRRMIGA